MSENVNILIAISPSPSSEHQTPLLSVKVETTRTVIRPSLVSVLALGHLIFLLVIT